jgi:hypothetical protein
MKKRYHRSDGCKGEVGSAVMGAKKSVVNFKQLSSKNILDV